ncbi:MAG TPA: hypothetical protein VII56_03840 [Rhizomicrobium sp.]
MIWLSSLDTWLNHLSPLDFMVYAMSPPLLLVAAVAVYFAWRENHRPNDPHAAE